MSQLGLGLGCRPRMRLPIRQPQLCMVISRAYNPNDKSRNSGSPNNENPLHAWNGPPKLPYLGLKGPEERPRRHGKSNIKTLRETLSMAQKKGDVWKYQGVMAEPSKFTTNPNPGLFRLTIMIIGQFQGPGTEAIRETLKYLRRLSYGGGTYQMSPTYGPRVAAQLEKYTRRVVEMRISVLTDMASQYVALARVAPFVPDFLPQHIDARLDRFLYFANQDKRSMRKSLEHQTEMVRLFAITLDHYQRAFDRIKQNGAKEAAALGIQDVPQFEHALREIRRATELSRESGYLAAEASQRVWDLNFDAVYLVYTHLRNRWVTLGLTKGELSKKPPRLAPVFAHVDNLPRNPAAFSPDWRLMQFERTQ